MKITSNLQETKFNKFSDNNDFSTFKCPQEICPSLGKSLKHHFFWLSIATDRRKSVFKDWFKFLLIFSSNFLKTLFIILWLQTVPQIFHLFVSLQEAVKMIRNHSELLLTYSSNPGQVSCSKPNTYHGEQALPWGSQSFFVCACVDLKPLILQQLSDYMYTEGKVDVCCRQFLRLAIEAERRSLSLWFTRLFDSITSNYVYAVWNALTIIN